ncbi:hypothetical protein Syun_008444 [Stephania yunnanensis]|uniref:Uncharacterized protein n=1 Tax=Stephania yunnanensis TaxID=152371 RepID=A0AAP0KFA3_9MAGN
MFRGTTGTPPAGHRMLGGGDVDMVFEFFEDGGGDGSLGSCSSGSGCSFDHQDDDDEERIEDVEESRAFWEEKHQILQATLCRTTTLESAIRRATKEALRGSQLGGEAVCVCKRPVANGGGCGGGGCRVCLLREISNRLQNAGFDSAICKSKWRKSPDIPSGEHTYVDVVEKPGNKKGEIRVIVELNLKGEFEMARASEEYNKLVNELPQVFVGKSERLLTVIKTMCCAAKKCMKEKKMHMGPWRKHKYMQAKWFGNYERTVPRPISPTGLAAQHRAANKPRASMLTIDLLDTLPAMQHFTAVEVV